MSMYEIKTRGCDDSTEIEMELTDAEAAVIARVSAAINEASQFGCMPKLFIEPATEGN